MRLLTPLLVVSVLLSGVCPYRDGPLSCSHTIPIHGWTPPYSAPYEVLYQEVDPVSYAYEVLLTLDCFTGCYIPWCFIPR